MIMSYTEYCSQVGSTPSSYSGGSKFQSWMRDNIFQKELCTLRMSFHINISALASNRLRLVHSTAFTKPSCYSVLCSLQIVDGTYVVNQSTMLSYLLLYLKWEENIKFTEIMCKYKGITFTHLIMHKKVVLYHESGYFNFIQSTVWLLNAFFQSLNSWKILIT